MKKRRHILERGAKLEERVRIAIGKLEKIGFAHDISSQDRLKDRDGNVRKIDLSFVLSTCLIDLVVTVECKSRGRRLTLAEVDQIKVFKSELPKRNIFWLVADGEVNENVRIALESSGVAYYSIDDLEQRIESICTQYGASDIPRLRSKAATLSTMFYAGFWQTVGLIEEAERKLLEPLGVTAATLSQGHERSGVRLSPCEDPYPPFPLGGASFVGGESSER